MKFIKLEIQNLASLDRQGGEIINFEEGALGDSTIFSIVGPTGSGKSTILDAICLALYNRAPRYPRKKGDRGQNIEIYGELEAEEKNRLAPTDSRNIITRGKKEGYSKLTFLANNGTVYRAEWYVRKKTKKFDEPILSLYKVNVTNGVQSEDVDDWNKLPQIIGLDYDQFLRTVLIAQGSFANFLTAKENERYELLEKLIGCEELYTSIATKIKLQKDEAVKVYDQIAANFKAQEKDIIPEEELTALAAQIEELEQKEKAAKQELLKVTEALNWFAENEKHQQNLEKFQQAFNQARERMESFAEQANRLTLHDATLPAVALFKEIETSQANIATQEKALTAFLKTITEKEQLIQNECEVALKQLQQSAKSAADEYESQKPHINKARETKTELDGLKTSLTEKTKAREEAYKALEKANKDVADNEKSIAKAESALQKSRREQTLLQEEIKDGEKQVRQKAEEAASAYAVEAKKLEGCDATTLQEAKTKADNSLWRLKSAIRIQTDLKAKRKNLHDTFQRQKQLTERNHTIAEQLKTFKIEELSKELDTLDRTYTLMVSENLGKLRGNLVDGEACPLCGATHHPYHDKETIAPIIDEMSSLIAQKREKLNEQSDLQQQLNQEQSKNNGLLDGIKKTLQTTNTEIAALNAEWSEIIAAETSETNKMNMPNGWSEDVEALQTLKPQMEKQVADAEASLKAYNDLLKRVDLLRKAKESAEKAQQDYAKTAAEKNQAAEKKVTDANTLLETEKGKTDNLKSQQTMFSNRYSESCTQFAKAQQDVDAKAEALKQEIGDKDPDAYEKALSEAKTKADEAVRAKTDHISQLRQQLNEIKGKQSATKTQKDKEVGIVASKKNELSSWLSEYNESHADHTLGENSTSMALTEETISQLYHSTDNWENIRAQRDQLSKNYTTAETTLQNETEAYKRHQQSRPDSVFEEMQKRKAELEALSNQELVDAKARLQRHNTAKEQMGNIYLEKQGAESIKQEWEEIYDAIGSDGKTLRKIAQCYTLRFLIEHANAEIRKFNNRYELLQVKNSLGIRVIDHDRADDIRDTTSLSGGETFIVSLGLALGLSSLSSRNISFENLFIDEGFGTLDPEALDTVINSLAGLQTSQGKKVGIISHTDTMYERISTQIRIIKNGNSGSSHIDIYP